jgi:hypothetical protein
MHSLALVISFGAEVAWRLKWARTQQTTAASNVKKLVGHSSSSCCKEGEGLDSANSSKLH